MEALVLAKTDWLNSRPVFYNTKTQKVSGNINEVIDPSAIEFDVEGLSDYLDFGFSVFDQSPVRDVKFLPPCSELKRGSSGGLVVSSFPDPIYEWMEQTTDVRSIADCFRESVTEWAKSSSSEIILPLSGGFDSRMLAWALPPKSHVHAYTYGISYNQSESFEVRQAAEVAKRLNIPWAQIELGHFHSELKDWIKIFGASTHAHGMYQMEFYKKILQKELAGKRLLSGIVGDAFAGSFRQVSVSSPKDLLKIGYSHGLNADSAQLHRRGRGLNREHFWEKHKSVLPNLFFQTITMVRMKMILLSYLLRIPEHFHFQAWSPFLNMEVSLGMTALPMEQRENRKWQRELLRKEGLLVEDNSISSSSTNFLNLFALHNLPLEPLDVDLLAELFKDSYIEWINRELGRFGWTREIVELIRYRWNKNWLFDRMNLQDSKLKAYYAYLTLKPIEDLLKLRK